MTDGPYDRRTRAAQDRLATLDADAAVVPPGSNLRYLTGITAAGGERHFLLFLPADGPAVLLVPDLYETQVRAAPWVPDLRTWSDGEDPQAAVERTVETAGLAGADHVLVDDAMQARFTLAVRDALPGATLALAGPVFEPLRVRKDEAELAALRHAGEIADRVVDEVRALGPAAVGTTERELAADIERRLREAGGEGIPFGPLVAAGPGGGEPHHRPGDREIRAGDPVVLDFGTTVDGYVSDQTRTVVFDGSPAAGFETVHETVRAAQAAGVDAVEPGVTAGAVDAAARDVIEAAGHGDEFVHRTGHGVGLDVHEAPNVAAGDATELEPGMVFSVEPGIYLPDEYGVRIEDLVVVTDDGCERLNRTDRGYGV
jgi:Xaa-Pro aminopeptidase